MPLYPPASSVTGYLENDDGGKGEYQSHGNTGATETIDLANGNLHSVTMDASCTFTFTGATNGVECAFTMRVHQPAAGGPTTATWPGSVVWPAAGAPTLATAANAVDHVSFYTTDGGTIWYGFYDVSGGGGTPDAHAASHEDGGSDEIDVTGLTGAGGGGISQGTSFPGSPSDNDLYFRNDLQCGLYRYEATGTMWRCTAGHKISWMARALYPISATNVSMTNAPTLGTLGQGDMWLDDMEVATFVTTTSSGTQYWTITCEKLTYANSATAVGTVSTISNAADVWVEEKVAIGALVDGATYGAFRAGATKVSTPGTLIAAIDVTWRHCFDV